MPGIFKKEGSRMHEELRIVFNKCIYTRDITREWDNKKITRILNNRLENKFDFYIRQKQISFRKENNPHDYLQTMKDKLKLK